MIASFGVFVLLLLLATFLGVKPEPPADPNDAAYIPRPEWYFLFLFQLLKYFPGKVEWIGTTRRPRPGRAGAAAAAVLRPVTVPPLAQAPAGAGRSWARPWPASSA